MEGNGNTDDELTDDIYTFYTKARQLDELFNIMDMSGKFLEKTEMYSCF